MDKERTKKKEQMVNKSFDVCMYKQDARRTIFFCNTKCVP